MTKEEIRQAEWKARDDWFKAYTEMNRNAKKEWVQEGPYKKFAAIPDPETEKRVTELKAVADNLRAEGIRLFATPEVADCDTCKSVSVFGGPPHYGSPRCRSGKRPHCTCDTCF